MKMVSCAGSQAAVCGVVARIWTGVCDSNSSRAAGVDRDCQYLPLIMHVKALLHLLRHAACGCLGVDTQMLGNEVVWHHSEDIHPPHEASREHLLQHC